MKHEWRKHEKALYLPKNKPEIITVPSYNFFMISGIGNPNSPGFTKCIETLYALSYTVRMSHKWEKPPENYFEYTVYPLEGIWDLADKSKYKEGPVDKDNLAYKIMIRQPGFVTPELANTVLKRVKLKKPALLANEALFYTYTEGLCVQMMHTGSYDDEPVSFEKMETFASEQGYKRVSKVHKEIYISDPRKTTPEKLKTVLRFNAKEL